MPTAPAPEQSFSSVWAKGRIQLTRYGHILRKRWWILVLTISLGLCGGAWFVSQLPPAYLSVGRMMVSGQIRLSEGGAGYSEELVNFFGTQVELMQSTEVRKRALARVQALHPEFVPDQVKLEVGQVPRASIFIMRCIGQVASLYPSLPRCLHGRIRGDEKGDAFAEIREHHGRHSG